MVPAGQTGLADYNKEGLKESNKTKPAKLQYAINSCKAFLRDHIPNNNQEIDLKNFLMNLEKNDGIQSLYNTSLGFFDDFQHMQMQYLRLYLKLDFAPYVEILEVRMRKFVKKLSSQSKDDKTAMQILFTALLSRIVAIKTNENRATVLNIPVYLDLVQERIEILRNIEKHFDQKEYQDQYKNSLDAKIKEALVLIQTDIVPEIDKSFEDIGRSVEGLLEEIAEMIEEEEGNIVQLNALRKKLEKQIIFNTIMSVFKVAAAVACLFGPMGFAIAGAIGSGVLLAESLVDINDLVYYYTSQTDENQLKDFATSFNDSINKVNAVFFEEVDLYKMQLDDMIELMDKESNNNPEIIDYINKEKDAMEFLQRNNNTNITNPNDIRERRNELQKKLNGTKWTNERIHKILDGIVEVARAGKAMYNQIRGDLKEISEVDAQIKYAKTKIKIYQDLSNQIMEVLVPIVIKFHAYVQTVTKNLANKSPVHLDLVKWEVQRRLSDIKLLFSKVAENTIANSKLKRGFAKIEEGFAVLINVYDRIDSYKEKAKFAFFFGKMLEGRKPDIKDPELNTAVLNMNKVIQSNLIMEQHELAVHAFKQQQFPFAQFHLSQFEFPSDLMPNDTETLIRTIESQIHNTKDAIIRGKVTLGKYDSELFKDVEFGSNGLVPFYKWDSRDIEMEVENLLNGKDIIIRSDIRKAVNQNAVKFNEIEFKLVTEPPTAQAKLDELLRNYNLIVKMVGNGYYKCGNRFYYISVDENIVLEYSMRKGSDGRPAITNEVYRKIRENAYFVSPYAVWSIRLDNPNMTSILVNTPVHLELTGRGQYFKNGQYASEVCTHDLDRFYHSDGPATTVAAIRKFKFIYSL